MVLKFLVPIALVAALAGCGSIGAIGLPWKREKPVQPEPIASTAVSPVESTDLGPPGDTTVAGLPADGSDATSEPLSPRRRDTAMTHRLVRVSTAASAAPIFSAAGRSPRRAIPASCS